MNKNIILSFLLSSSILMQALLSPYSDLKEVLPFNDHGWYGNSKWIEKLMTENKISTVIEIGSWLGCSTRHIASLLQPNGKLYAIDTWKGSIEHYQNKKWNAMLPTLYDQFLSNVIHAGLTNIIIPIRMTSLEAVYFLAKKLKSVDMVYVDAAHDTESVLKDLYAYWPLVRDNGGILCGDDWACESVRIAVSKFAQEYNLTIYAGRNFWFLKKEDCGYCYKSFLAADDSAWKFGSK
jgi:hypothetical protein